MIEELFNVKEKAVSVKTIVDNKLMVDAVHSTAPIGDKKLRRDVDRIKQMLIMMDIKSIFWCQGRDQFADCVMKRTTSSFKLMQVLKSGRR